MKTEKEPLISTRSVFTWISAFLAALCLIVVTGSASAQDKDWELRVCAAPDNLPASGREQPGFENRIAEIIADELKAWLTYEWMPINDQAITNIMRAGACDVVMGVADGAAGLLSTVAYYRTPYVLVYRSGNRLLTGSLEDPELKGLRIATYPNSGPHRALINYGLEENLKFVQPRGSANGPDYVRPLLDALMDNEIDVALVDGSRAGYYANQHQGELGIIPVSPEIVPPMLQMFRIATMAVRPSDEALRDRINVALANRWDDVQAVLAEYAVPIQATPRPLAPLAPQLPAQVGVILPMPTGTPHSTDTVGLAARYGALLAEDLALLESQSSAANLQIKLADSPSGEAAYRAAQRLIATEGVVALVGGFGDDQAAALLQVAIERGVLFFNIGSLDPLLRKDMLPGVFHIEASAQQYIVALVDSHTAQGVDSWFVIHDSSSQGHELGRQASEVIAQSGNTEVGTAEVDPGQFVYYDTLERIATSSATGILVLLSAGDQEQFLAQYDSLGLGLSVVLLPYPLSQTRDFLIRLKSAAPEASLQVRAALWEPTLQESGAADLNVRFIGRTGKPLDSAGWAAYAAITILDSALAASGSTEPAILAAYLEGPEARFSVSKRSNVFFDAQTHQLKQPLYLIQINPEASWGLTASDQLKLARLVDVIDAPD